MNLSKIALLVVGYSIVFIPNSYGGALSDMLERMAKQKQQKQMEQEASPSSPDSSKLISSNQVDEYQVPEFKSLGEKKTWKENNQKEVDLIYSALRKKESELGKELLVSDSDSSDTVDKKYQVADDIFTNYQNERNEIFQNYKQLIARCYITQCTLTDMSQMNLQSLYTGHIRQNRTYSFIDTDPINDGTCNRTNDNNKNIYLTFKPGNFGLSSPYFLSGFEEKTAACALWSIFNAGRDDTIEKYKSYLKEAYESIDEKKNKLAHKQQSLNPKSMIKSTPIKPNIHETENQKNLKLKY